MWMDCHKQFLWVNYMHLSQKVDKIGKLPALIHERHAYQIINTVLNIRVCRGLHCQKDNILTHDQQTGLA